VQLAARGQSEYAFSVVLNSPLQIALVLAPVLVLVSVVFGFGSLTLVFGPMLIIALLLSVVLTALIAFDDVAVPEENLLGEENQGFYLIMANFQWERIMMALGAVGAMQAMFERTLAYAKERTAFGRPIGSHQVIRHKLAEIALRIEAGRDLTYHGLRRFVGGADAVQEVTMAKLATQRAAFDTADDCLQIHGGAGYMVEYDIERAARDARLGPIGGGTDEIMKEILGKSFGL